MRRNKLLSSQPRKAASASGRWTRMIVIRAVTMELCPIGTGYSNSKTGQAAANGTLPTFQRSIFEATRLTFLRAEIFFFKY
eukprot:scaffold4450_cov113-Isochrysis_galbana.AAC.1